MAAAQETAVGRELLLFIEVPTVITATGREQPLTEAPTAISVITAEEIRQSGATSIPELLRFVPGLDFTRTSASNVSIAARGLNLVARSRMQVLVDGHSVYEDVLGIVYWHQIPIPLEEIERIEIVRSPATALYGDKAFAGVVHIITKSPEALKGTLVSTTFGEAGTTIVNAIHADVVGDLSYKVSVGYDRRDQLQNPDFDRGDEGRADKRGYFNINYKLGGDSRVSLSGGIDEFDRREVLNPGPLLEVVAGQLAFLKANYVVGDAKAQLSYNLVDVVVRSESFPEDAPAVASVYQAQVQQGFALGQANVLTAGAAYRFITMDSEELVGGTEEQHLLSFFLQDEWKLRDDLRMTVGAGLDIHPEAGASLSPRVSLVYSPWRNHTFRGSVARAFRNPAFLESFEALPLIIVPPPPPFYPQTFTILGNEDLKPEELLAYELGYQTRFFERVLGRIDLFYYQLDELIGLRQPVFFTPIIPFFPTIQTGSQFVNVDDGEILGGEVGIDVIVTSWSKGFLNYSYQDRKGDVTLMGLASNHKGNVGMTFSFIEGLSATALVHYTGPLEGPTTQGIGPWTIVNTRVGYRFKLLGNETEVALQVFNLLDYAHQEIPGGDLIRREVSGTVRYRF